MPGTGLGLHIARQIVELHEGEVGWENASDGGCFFYLDLPIQASEAEKAA
jgi:K+-sensing histidine kinase KdpD